MDLKKQEDHLVQLIKRLINGDYYTSKSTAAAIIAGIYPRKIKFDFHTKLIIFYKSLYASLVKFNLL